jgi:8-oxo-dGTP pyrophosphatase MutT (NUDIX family)
VLVRETEAGRLTLMLRAYQHWDFPKGMLEDGETAMQTAIRELGEETGIRSPAFNWGDRYFESGPYSRGKVARYFLASTAEQDVVMGPSPETGRPEHHEWRWVSFDEAYDLSAPRVKEVVQWARQIIGT